MRALLSLLLLLLLLLLCCAVATPWCRTVVGESNSFRASAYARLHIKSKQRLQTSAYWAAAGANSAELTH